MEQTLQRRILSAQEHLHGEVTSHCQAGRCEHAKRAFLNYHQLVNDLSNRIKSIRQSCGGKQ